LGFEFDTNGWINHFAADGVPRILVVRTAKGDVPARPGESTIIRASLPSGDHEWYPIAADVERANYEAIPQAGPAQVFVDDPPELIRAVELPDGSTLNIVTFDDGRVRLNVVGGDRFVSAIGRSDNSVTVHLDPRPGGGQP